MTRIQLDERLSLPQQIYSRSFNDEDVHIAREIPSWIVTTPLESRVLKELRTKTVREAACSLQGDPETAEATVHSLLQKITDADFYQGGASSRNETLAMHLYLTNECNLRCRHCYKSAGEKKYGELTTEEWKHAIDQLTDIALKRKVPTHVVMSGGEVMTRADFFELADYVNANGHAVNVVSNGTLIENRETAERIAQVANFFQVSLDGATEHMNDFYRGKGTYKKVIAAINHFTGLDFLVNIGMVISGMNIEDYEHNLSHLLSQISHARIGLNVSPLMEYGRGASCKAHDSSLDYVERFFMAAQKLGITPKKWRVDNSKAYDCGFARSVTVDATGDIFYCPVTTNETQTTMNIRTTPLESIYSVLEEKHSSISVENMSECTSCELTYLCGGGCRLQNILQHGDALSPVCTPERKEFIYKELIKLRK